MWDSVPPSPSSIILASSEDELGVHEQRKTESLPGNSARWAGQKAVC